ncbi:MAG: VOC family protein [Xanthomonadales bacterium]|nr:VOC family protein [Xanthomonadales bacterium]
MSASSESIGPIIQFSYVVADLDRAIAHWAETLGVAPFFVMAHVPYKTCLFRGEPTDLDMSVALAYSGGVQVELVQQHNQAPSIFREFLDQRGEGLQHVGTIVDDLAASLANFAGQGIFPVQEGEAENGTLFAYMDTDRIPGTMLELFQLPAKIASAFDYMKQASCKWNPGDPIRRG